MKNHVESLAAFGRAFPNQRISQLAAAQCKDEGDCSSRGKTPASESPSAGVMALELDAERYWVARSLDNPADVLGTGALDTCAGLICGRPLPAPKGAAPPDGR